jgi:toxin ParE1/3/4
MRKSCDVILLPAAEEDLLETIDYSLQDRPSAAIAMLERFQKNFDAIGQNPAIGKVVQDEELVQWGYRYIIISNYLVFYILKAGRIELHRIIHSARDYIRVLS